VTVSFLDVLPLLNLTGSDPGVPVPFLLITVNPGESFSPDAVRPGNEAIYILEGSAGISVDDETVNASAGDSLLVPAGSVLMVTSTGQDPLRFFSVLSRDMPGTDRLESLIFRPAGNITPITFGRDKSRDRFEITRILSPFEEPLPLSFDLAIARVPAGNVIREHYLDSGQIGYVLAGDGICSINCINAMISAGDLIFIPPGGVQQVEAYDDLSLVFFTDPYYLPERDHQTEPVC
jgi:mannose-6-phosphate isomerase-like protein (cupin superfamily)